MPGTLLGLWQSRGHFSPGHDTFPHQAPHLTRCIPFIVMAHSSRDLHPRCMAYPSCRLFAGWHGPPLRRGLFHPMLPISIAIRNRPSRLAPSSVGGLPCLTVSMPRARWSRLASRPPEALSRHPSATSARGLHRASMLRTHMMPHAWRCLAGVVGAAWGLLYSPRAGGWYPASRRS